MTVTQQRLPGLSQDWNERFVEMLPQIRRTIRYAIRRAPRDARDEEMADSIAHAYCGFARLVNQGKGDRAFGTTLARYAVLRVRSGRRVGGRCNVRDLTSPFARRGRGIDVIPLVEQTAGGTWEEIVVEDRRSSPADIAACRLDFKAWLKRLDRKKRVVALCLAAGEGTYATARRFGLTPARISQLRGEFMRSWHEFQGEQPARVAA